MWCCAPHVAAPNLISNDEETEAAHSCYFKRQPTTVVEEDEAIKAMHFSCCKALRYAGSDERILNRLSTFELLDCADWEIS